MTDMDNMGMIMARRQQLLDSNAPTYNKGPMEGASLIPGTTKPGKKPRLGLGPMIALIAGGTIPALTQYFVLKWSHSSLLTILAMSGLYCGLVFVHSTFVDKHVWQALSEADIRPSALSGKYKTDLVLSAVAAALGVSLIACLYSAYVPFGPAEIDVYFAAGNGFVRFLLWFVYFGLQAIVLPLFESFFFFFALLSYLHASLAENAVVAVLFGLAQAAWISQSIGNWPWIVWLTLLATLLGWFCTVAARKESFLKGFGIRFGVGIAICVYLQFLNVGFEKGWTKAPDRYITSWQ